MRRIVNNLATRAVHLTPRANAECIRRAKSRRCFSHPVHKPFSAFRAIGWEFAYGVQSIAFPNTVFYKRASNIKNVDFHFKSLRVPAYLRTKSISRRK